MATGLATILAGTLLVADLRTNAGNLRKSGHLVRAAGLAHVHQVIVDLAPLDGASLVCRPPDSHTPCRWLPMHL